MDKLSFLFVDSVTEYGTTVYREYSCIKSNTIQELSEVKFQQNDQYVTLISGLVEK